MNLSDTNKLKELQKQAKREKGDIRRAKKKLEKVAISNASWQKFKGQELPQSAIDWISRYEIHAKANGHMDSFSIFRNHNCWCIGYVYFKGPNAETATEWIITTDDGGYYKVGAEAMVWYTGLTGGSNSSACWSIKSLRDCIKKIIIQGVPTRDPNYTT